MLRTGKDYKRVGLDRVKYKIRLRYGLSVTDKVLGCTKVGKCFMKSESEVQKVKVTFYFFELGKFCDDARLQLLKKESQKLKLSSSDRPEREKGRKKVFFFWNEQFFL